MRRIASTVTAVLAVALMVPGLGTAEVIQPDCILDGVMAPGASCTDQFELTAADADRKVSMVGTHGGIHGYPNSGARGRVSLQWLDANADVVAEWDCLAIANNADYLPLELTRVACSEVTAPPSSLPAGVFTMKATVTQIENPGPLGSRLHGRIVFRDIPV